MKFGLGKKSKPSKAKSGSWQVKARSEAAALVPPRFPCVAICGVGLLGGSLGLALREKKVAGQIIGVGRNAERLKSAMDLGAIDEYSLELREVCPLADLIVLCGPISIILGQLPDVMESAKPGAVITDVGSTKRTIVESATILVRDDLHFVGSHPMAGSEKSGAAHARADLFEGAKVILTPNLATTDEALESVRFLWESIGMKAVELLPARHDQFLAMVSHLPHLAAAALVEQLERTPQTNMDALRAIAGPGFADTTRIAMGSAEMWTDIFMDNKEAVIASIDVLAGVLSELREEILAGRRDRISLLLERAAELRKTFER